MIKWLCHIWLGTHTQLMVVQDRAQCYTHPQAQQVWAQPYDMKSDFERRRLAGICGYSSKRCPGYVDKPENGPSPPGSLDYHHDHYRSYYNGK